MHHAFIDTYAGRPTPLKRISPALRIFLLLVFLLFIVLTPLELIYFFTTYFLLTITLVWLAGAPIRFILRRIAAIAPLVLVISFSALFSKSGFALFASCLVKSVLAITAVLAVVSSMPFLQLLEALKKLRIPGIFIQIFSFMYRYSFLLEDEFLRKSRAFEARKCGRVGDFRQVRVLSNLLAVIFLHTYERAERVYLAMCARGYDGK